MQTSLLLRCGIAAAFLNVTLCGTSQVADAQIITDGTMGPAGQLLGPNYQIPAALGHKFGPNLFHSFLDFQLNGGESATFSGPASVRNILSRVTGGVPSLINGQLNSTIGGANFFFINPAGTVFGPGAQVNVSGSFVVSSADVVKLGKTGSFNALDPAATVLTSAPPQAFGFLTPNPQPIRFFGSQLVTAPGRSFSVIGGGIGISGGSFLVSTGGMNLVSVGSAGEVALDFNKPSQPIGFKEFTRLGDIVLTGGSELLADGAGGITLRGKNLVLDSSGILATNDGSNPGSAEAIDVGLTDAFIVDHASGVQAITGDASPGPAIVIRANQIVLGENGLIESITQGAGQGGEITLEAGQLLIYDGANVNSSTQGRGQGGAINVSVDDLEAVGTGSPTGIFAITQASGNGGTLNIDAKNIYLEKAAITTNSLGAGQGGALTIFADTIAIEGGETNLAGISADARSTGRGGTVSIDAHDIQLRNGAAISTSTNGLGDGGSIDLAADNIVLEGKSVATGVRAVTVGRANGGTISIVAGKLQVLGNAAVLASSFGTGASGNITIGADQIILDGRNLNLDPQDLLANSGIVSESRRNDSGRGGAISITTNDLQMRRGALVSTTTYSPNRGGDITVDAGQINIDGRDRKTGISAGTANGGLSGNIKLTADSLKMAGEGIISSSTGGAGRGGNITIAAHDILLDGANSNRVSGITSVSQPTAPGDGGNISITADRLQIVGRIGIDNSTASTGKSGDIDITARQILLDDRGTEQNGISSSSVSDTGGDSGKIRITADDLQIKGAASISSLTTGHSRGGEIDIRAKNVLIDAQNQAGAHNVISDTIGTGGSAQGGSISIHGADSFTMQNGALISSSTAGAGQGGSISIDARDVRIESGSFVTALTVAAGHGGNIAVKADNLTVDGQGDVTGFSADTSYAGPQPDDQSSAPKLGTGGTISLTAKNLIMRDNGYASTSTANEAGQTATGDAGTIHVDAGEVLIDHSLIASLSSGTGKGGTVDLKAAGSVTLKHGQISVRGLQKDAGDIFLKVGDTLSLADFSNIDTEARENGGSIDVRIGRSYRSKFSLLSAFAGNNGGNVTIDSQPGQPIPHDIIVDRSGISAQAINGSGGRIQLRSKVFLPSNDALISASSTFGTNGTVSIESPNTNVGGSLIVLPSSLLDAESHLAERCVIRTTGASSSFTVDAQNGIPPQPGDLLPSPAAH